MERIEHRHRVARSPEGLVGGGIVGARYPHRAAASLPRIVVALPGFAAGLAGCRYRELAPQALAGRGIEPGDPVAHALIAIGGADDDLVLDGKRRCREGHVRRVRERGFPDHLPGFLVGRDDAWRVAEAAGTRDAEVAPQPPAPEAHLPILLGIH